MRRRGATACTATPTRSFLSAESAVLRARVMMPVIHRSTTDGDIVLTVRSLTRPALQQPWRALYPLLRIAQVVARRRYLRALR